jgi:hypothetical protein
LDNAAQKQWYIQQGAYAQYDEEDELRGGVSAALQLSCFVIDKTGCEIYAGHRQRQI